METTDLFAFINSSVPNLVEIEIISAGKGYHYTMHSDSIERMGTFLGRPVDEDLDRSQSTLTSNKATDKEGVVCAYPDLSAAVQEGKYGDCHIYEIYFSEAVSAYHQQEKEFAKSFGGKEITKTQFILAHKITNFKVLGRSSELKGKLS